MNPFIVSGKIEPKYFCDRVDESGRLIREVTNGNNLVLISPRRMGKTGLIRYCFMSEALSCGYNTIYVDILQTSSLKEFTFALGKEIFDSLQPLGRKTVQRFMALLKSLSGSFGIDTVTGSPTFNIQLGDIEAPEYTLEEIFRFLEEQENRTILAIDEFQQIARYPEKNVEALLRSHIQRSAKCNFIFAGSERHMMQQMFTSSARPFYNSASIMELNAIPLPVYSEFVGKLFVEAGKRIESQNIEYAYTLFEGHTYYMQKCFNYAYSATTAGAECTRAIIDNAINEMLFSYDTLYREILSQLPLRQKELLYAIAKEGHARAITSATFIRRHSLASASSVQAAAAKLRDCDLISMQNRSYSVSDKLLHLWIKRNI